MLQVTSAVSQVTPQGADLCVVWTVGDIHGDLRKAIASLEAAQVLQEQQGQVKWSGGDTTVVQLGDVLDRGDSEIGQAATSNFCLCHFCK